MPIIQTTNLTRVFDDVTAVDSIDLRVNEGEVYGFLGPNGAGKSTTINMLLNYVPPTSGSGEVLGYDIVTESKDIRQRIGVLPEDFGVYPRLTARKHVQFAIDSKGVDEDPSDHLTRVGLSEAIDRKAGGFSSGMKQRLALAMALVGDPQLLILDEPSTGLDPNGAREMQTIVREEVDRGATVFFSSHIMGQVEAVCDRVGIMRNGQLVVDDTIRALKKQMQGTSTLTVTVETVPDGIDDTLRGVDSVTAVDITGNDIVISLSGTGNKTAVLTEIEESGASIQDFTAQGPSLEDLFAAVTTNANEEVIDA